MTYLSQLDVTAESVRDLDRLVERSKRISGARLPASFARGEPPRAPSLARLVQGGRGGEVRLKLYLSMVLLAGSGRRHPDHGTNAIANVAGPTWARMLGLPDPSGKGARRVADAQDSLRDLKLITVERRHGTAPIVRLLHPGGSGAPFVEPGTPYIRVPLSVWTDRWIWKLNARELAVLVALVDLCGSGGRDGTGGPQPLASIAPDRYGLSAETWRLASLRLVDLGLLKVDVGTIGRDLDTPRRQKLYELQFDRLHTAEQE